MINILNKVDCSGCCACVDSCAHSAIKLEVDNEGFWYPVVDENACTDCGICDKICPDINIEKLKKNDLNEPECYVAIHKNIEIRFDSTSGGIFSALASKTYKEGGYVGGAVFNEDFSVSHLISNDKADLSRLRSSKYLQSNATGLYSDVRRLLKAGAKVLVCGCPCQMAGLRSFLRKDYEDLIIVDFICRGINSPKVFRRYLDYLEDRFQSKITYFKAKNKELGWRQLASKIVFENKSILYDTKDTSYFTKGYLHTGVYSRPSCYDCKYKGFPRIADITIADFWGVEKVAGKEYDNDLGTSAVLLNSTKGVKYYESIKNNILTKQVPLAAILEDNKALTQPLDPPKVNRELFYNALDLKPFSEVAREFIDKKESSKTRLKNKLKASKRNFSSLAHKTSIRPKPLWQFIFYNFFKKGVVSNFFSSSLLFPSQNNIIEIQKGGLLKLNDKFILGAKRFKKSRIESRVLIERRAVMELQGYLSLGYGADVEVFEGAHLKIGKGCDTNINTTIICGDSITLGDGVMIGRDVTIRDNNGDHYISRRGYKNNRPVTIGNHVWLCEGCTIMPGVKIGDGAIIGAGSLVISNVPANSMVSGNPAVIVDENVYWKY